MECNRYWNWDIHSDHTNLNFAHEIARSVTISSEDSDTVPIGVVVDQFNRSYLDRVSSVFTIFIYSNQH